MESPTNGNFGIRPKKDTRRKVKGMVLSEAFGLYASSVITFRNQSDKTLESHNVCLSLLVQYFGNVEIETLTFEDIRRWKVHLDKTRCDSTVRGYIIKLRVVLGFHFNNGLNCLSPDQIPVPHRTDTVPIFLNKDQIQILIDSTERIKNKAIISLLYSSGIRVSELCSLNRDSIQDNSFTVVGKGGKARLCFVDQRSQNLIKAYLKTREDNDNALFLTDAGYRIRPQTVQETFKSVRKRSGIQCHAHTLRHSFATNLLQSNTNLYHVQQFLGHRSLQTTQQYLHVVDMDLQNVYKKHHTV